ncbi:MAG: hypothetical protein ACK55Z_10290, partial [bacterium]|jgi:hypothetical protein
LRNVMPQHHGAWHRKPVVAPDVSTCTKAHARTHAHKHTVDRILRRLLLPFFLFLIPFQIFPVREEGIDALEWWEEGRNRGELGHS